jgi:hypothetical protein
MHERAANRKPSRGGDLPAEDLPAEDLPAEDLPAEDLPAEDLPAEHSPEDLPKDQAIATSAGSLPTS